MFVRSSSVTTVCVFLAATSAIDIGNASMEVTSEIVVSVQVKSSQVAFNSMWHSHTVTGMKVT